MVPNRPAGTPHELSERWRWLSDQLSDGRQSTIALCEAAYQTLADAAKLLEGSAVVRQTVLADINFWETYLRAQGFPLPVPEGLHSFHPTHVSQPRHFVLGVSEFLQDSALPLAFLDSIMRDHFLHVELRACPWWLAAAELQSGAIDGLVHNRTIHFQSALGQGKPPIIDHWPPLYLFRGHSLYVRRPWLEEALRFVGMDQATATAPWTLDFDSRLRLLATPGTRFGAAHRTDLATALATLLARTPFSDRSRGGRLNPAPEISEGRRASARALIEGSIDVLSPGISEAIMLDTVDGLVVPLFRVGEVPHSEVDLLFTTDETARKRGQDIAAVIARIMAIHRLVRRFASQGDDASLAEVLGRIIGRLSELQSPEPVVPSPARFGVAEFRSALLSGNEVLFRSAFEASLYLAKPRVGDELRRSALVITKDVIDRDHGPASAVACVDRVLEHAAELQAA